MPATKNKPKTFTVRTGSRRLRLRVLTPTKDQRDQAALAYAVVYHIAVEAGVPTLAEAREGARALGLWDDAREARVTELQGLLAQGARDLEAADLSLEDALDLVGRMRLWRQESQSLYADLARLEEPAAECRGLKAAFESTIAATVVHADSRRPVFRDADEYRAKADSALGRAAAEAVAAAEFNVTPLLPEEAYLASH